MAESPVLRGAIERLRAGDSFGAETVAADAVRAAERRFGATSPAYAAAQFDLAHVLGAIGDFTRAADALRAACGVVPTDAESQKARLTYLMNLGDFLIRLDKLDEAERVLRDGLSERARFYTTSHPGYGYGLEALAEALLAMGRAGEAKPLTEEALSIFWEHGHARIASALAQRSQILKAVGGADAPTFDRLGALPEDLFDAVVAECLNRAGHTDPALALASLRELRAVVSERRGAGSPLLVEITAAMTNAARFAQDHTARIEAFEWLVRALAGGADPERAIAAMLGLALALDDAGRAEDAKAAYEGAVAKSSDMAPSVRSQVLRNYGLFLAAQEERDAAAKILEDAVTVVRSTDDAEMTGRALIALGIFAQHGGRLDEARRLLEEGVSLLPVSDPDTLPARSHLDAITQNASCGCGNMDQAIGEAIRQMVLPLAPPDLIAELAIELHKDREPSVHVELAREPTEAELELIDRLLRQAMAKLRAEINARY